MRERREAREHGLGQGQRDGMRECADGDSSVGDGEPKPGDRRAGRSEQAGGSGNDRGEHNRQDRPQREAELGDGVMLEQISHDRGVDEDAGDRVAGLLRGARRRGQGASRPRCSVISAGQAH